MQRSGANRLQLLCLPYAGASATVFSRWRALVPNWLEVVPLELPGRGRRSAEPFARDLSELAEQLVRTVSAKLDASFGLFGHSMGAILAFEMASRLCDAGRAPRFVFASGSASPALRRRDRFVALDSEEALVAEMRRLNGTRPEVFENPDLLSLTLGILRADFAMCSRYQHQPRAPLESSLHVFGGLHDEIGLAELEAWRVHSRSAFTLDMLDGGHFFVHSQERRLLELVAQHAEPWRPRADSAPRAEMSHG